MNLEESLKQQIKELNSFVKKQTAHVKNYQAELNKSIESIEDKEIKGKLSTMMSEAMKGNVDAVQNIAKNLQNDLEQKNKADAS